jgi:hypothetical protein
VKRMTALATSRCLTPRQIAVIKTRLLRRSTG